MINDQASNDPIQKTTFELNTTDVYKCGIVHENYMHVTVYFNNGNKKNMYIYEKQQPQKRLKPSYHTYY